jgi:diguanylate cyclase (GGDEF)-like protein/PAS domain S-box-containing protein
MMEWHFRFFSVVLLMTSASAFIMAGVAFQRKVVAGSRWFAALLTGIGIWCLAEGLSDASIPYSQQIFFSQFLFVGSQLMAFSTFMFAMHNIGRGSFVKGLNLVILAVIPVATIALIFTNAYHRLLWSGFHLNPYGVLVYEHGVWFWIMLAFDYTVILAAMFLLVYHAWRAPRRRRSQVAALILGGAIPLVINIFYAVGLGYQGRDLTPIGFAAMAAIYAWNLAILRLFSLVPASREMLADTIQDGMLVVDTEGRLVDANAAARAWLDISNDWLGQPLPALLRLPELSSDMPDVRLERSLQGSPEREVEIRIRPVFDRDDILNGWMIILQDVTERKHAETDLRDSEEKYRQLFSMEGDARLLIDDTTGRILEVNPSAESMYGYTRDELLTLRNVDLSAEPEATRAQTKLDGKAYIPIRSHRRKDGTVFQVEITGQHFIWRGRKVHTVAIRDITSRVRQSETERKARQRTEAINTILSAISATLDMPLFFPIVYEQLSRFIKMDHFGITLRVPGALEWEPVFAINPAPDTMEHRFPLSYGASGYILTSSQTIMLNSMAEIVQFETRTDHPIGLVDLHAILAVPLMAAGETIGAMVTYSLEKEGIYSEDDLALFSTVGRQIAVGIQNARLYAQVQEMATTDTLTGVSTRRHFLELAEHEVMRFERYGVPFTFVMLDIDHFKVVNDTFGHREGDLVLAHVAQVIRDTVRKVDLVGRLGGEEFGVLLTDTAVDEGFKVAQRICRAVDAERVKTKVGEVHITVSVGVTGSGQGRLTFDDAYVKADRALYTAKRAGRNRVSRASSG